MSNEEKEQCRSKLWVWGTDLDPDQITDLLQIQPERAARRGEPSLRNHGGRAEPTRHINRVGHWRAGIAKEKELLDVAEQLEDWCRRLGERAAEVRKLQSQGCQMKIDFYISEGPVALVDLPPSILKKLGELNVGLSFGIYDVTSVEFQGSQTPE